MDEINAALLTQRNHILHETNSRLMATVEEQTTKIKDLHQNLVKNQEEVRRMKTEANPVIKDLMNTIKIRNNKIKDLEQRVQRLFRQLEGEISPENSNDHIFDSRESQYDFWIKKFLKNYNSPSLKMNPKYCRHPIGELRKNSIVPWYVIAQYAKRRVCFGIYTEFELKKVIHESMERLDVAQLSDEECICYGLEDYPANPYYPTK